MATTRVGQSAKAQPAEPETVDARSAEERDRLKSKEQWLREELRASRTQLSNQMQWGITVLAAVSINLYYIRKDVHTHLVQQHRIDPSEMLPFQRWIIGTILLIFLAWIFTSLTRRYSIHHGVYRDQLMEMNGGFSGIEEKVPRARFLHNAPSFLYFSIPALDIMAWTMFYAGEKLQFNFLVPW